MEQRCITTVAEPAHNGHPLIARDAMSRSTLLATALSTLLLSACASSPATPATAATSQPSAFTVEVPAISRPQGETAQWWGIFIIGLSLPFGILGIITPVIITYLLLFVSGVPMTEKALSKKRGWKQYAERVSIFLPLPPKK